MPSLRQVHERETVNYLRMYLSGVHPPAIRPRMRGALIRFLVVLSVLLAGTHAPVLAHDGAGFAVDSHHHEHASCENQSDQKQNSTADLGNETLHHHHCPNCLAGTPAELAITGLKDTTAFLPSLAKALASLATAPPLEPPLA